MKGCASSGQRTLVTAEQRWVKRVRPHRGKARLKKLQDGITEECVAGRDKVHSSQYFSRASAKVFRFFTAYGATQFFSNWTLETGVEIRATIEPDSQDVFLQVQQFRTLPFVAIPLYDACDGC